MDIFFRKTLSYLQSFTSKQILDKNKAAIKISKAFKKYKNLKVYKKCKENLPEYQQSLKEWDASIIQPIVTAVPPTPDRDDVLSKIPESLKKYYHIVSHDTFLHHLNKSWDKALDAIGDEPYRLLYITPKLKVKSEHWVAGLLLQHNPTFQPLPPPKLTKNYNFVLSNVSPEPNHYVVVDDAAYSGQQMWDNLVDIISQIKEVYAHNSSHLNDSHIHVIIPFISNNAKKNIQSIFKKNKSIKFSLYSSSIIMHYDEQKKIMTQDEKKERANIKYMTIFSHKQADSLSLGTSTNVPDGSVALYSKPETRKMFIEYLEEKKSKNET